MTVSPEISGAPNRGDQRCFARVFFLLVRNEKLLVLLGDVFGLLGNYYFWKGLVRHGNGVSSSIVRFFPHSKLNQPLLKIIFKNPPNMSFKRGKSLNDTLVRAKI